MLPSTHSKKWPILITAFVLLAGCAPLEIIRPLAPIPIANGQLKVVPQRLCVNVASATATLDLTVTNLSNEVLEWADISKLVVVASRPNEPTPASATPARSNAKPAVVSIERLPRKHWRDVGQHSLRLDLQSRESARLQVIVQNVDSVDRLMLNLDRVFSWRTTQGKTVEAAQPLSVEIELPAIPGQSESNHLLKKLHFGLSISSDGH